MNDYIALGMVVLLVGGLWLKAIRDELETKRQVYKTMASLKPIRDLLKEANEALKESKQ
jgi:hypothetical protein